MRKVTALLFGWILIITLATTAAARPTRLAAESTADSSRWMMASAPAMALTGLIHDSSGLPVTGAEIELYQLGVGLNRLAVTGDDGRFELPRPNSLGSLWQIRVWAKGYRILETGWFSPAATGYLSLKLEPLTGQIELSLRERGGRPVESRATIVSPGGQVAAVTAVGQGGTILSDLPAGEYRLVATAPGFLGQTHSVTVIPGQMVPLSFRLEEAASAISGEVVDTVTGIGLSGAQVEVLTADNLVAAAVTTNRTGRFAIAVPMESAGYRIRATAAGYRARVTEFSDQVALQPLTGTIVGTVLNVQGQPAAHTRVVLQLKGHGEIAGTVTGPDGRFLFAEVPSAPELLYRITADNVMEVAAKDWTGYASTDWTGVKPGLLNQVVVASVQGDYRTFGVSSIAGLIITPEGEPLANATVELLRRTRVIESTQTDSSGLFLLPAVGGTVRPDMQSAPYSVRVSKEGFIPTREFTVGDQSLTELHLSATSRAMIQTTLLAVKAELTGRVLDRDEKPVADARVELRVSGGAILASARTDAGGWYTLTQVERNPAAVYELRADANDYRTQGWLDVSAGMQGAKGLPTLRLTPVSATVEGQLISPDGRPLSGVTLQLKGPSGEELALGSTDSTGHYQMGINMPTGATLLLTADLQGWTGAASEVSSPPAGQSLIRNLVLFPTSAQVAGRVFGEGGTPVGMVALELVAEGRGVIATAMSGSDGRYVLDAAPLPAPAWVWVRIRPGERVLSGSLTYGTEVSPLLRLAPGERALLDVVIQSK